MRTRSGLTLAAAVTASVIVGVIAVNATATPNPRAQPATSAAAAPSSAAGPRSTSTPAATPNAAATPSRIRPGSNPGTAYAPPKPGQYTYSGPSGDTVTKLTVRSAGEGAWQLDEWVLAKSALVQRRQQAWTSSGVRVLSVWEAGQAQPCVWSTPPVDVAFPLTATTRWSVDASCKVVNGSAGQSVTHVRGSFRTTGPVRIRIAGQTVSAWLVDGTEVTTVDGTVRGHRYRTVDNTTTKVWFLPSIGMPGRTELAGTITITSEKGTTRHRIGQVTQLQNLTPQ